MRLIRSLVNRLWEWVLLTFEKQRKQRKDGEK
jgi:hypothetical protein